MVAKEACRQVTVNDLRHAAGAWQPWALQLQGMQMLVALNQPCRMAEPAWGAGGNAGVIKLLRTLSGQGTPAGKYRTPPDAGQHMERQLCAKPQTVPHAGIATCHPGSEQDGA